MASIAGRRTFVQIFRFDIKDVIITSSGECNKEQRLARPLCEYEIVAQENFNFFSYNSPNIKITVDTFMAPVEILYPVNYTTSLAYIWNIQIYSHFIAFCSWWFCFPPMAILELLTIIIVSERAGEACVRSHINQIYNFGKCLIKIVICYCRFDVVFYWYFIRAFEDIRNVYYFWRVYIACSECRLYHHMNLYYCIQTILRNYV